ncbi:hypothetical protein DID80_02040 [Candidatus Marinamargulisbacteria bacterium SCGC AAA071-K20]|nr:hypothetical protein DID80_02040 [Candidatus Marinamargulisbacteria bacterium SCGC AAA071-K20]
MNKSKIALLFRVLLGLPFLVFGLNGFFHFLPMPPMPGAAMSLMMAFGATGYFFPVLKITEIVAGALVLSGMYVPLALVLLAPIIVQIVLFHACLAPAGMLIPIVVLVAELVLAVIYKNAWKGILSAKTEI